MRFPISKYDTRFRKFYKPLFTEKVFELVPFASGKNATYPIGDEQYGIIRGRLRKKEFVKIIQQRNCLQYRGLLLRLQITQLLYKLFTGAFESGRSTGICIFGGLYLPGIYGLALLSRELGNVFGRSIGY